MKKIITLLCTFVLCIGLVGCSPKKPFEKRLEICTLAYERFIEEGVAEFSLNKFIESLNMSKGQFYYYFKSKEKLIFETLKVKELEFTKIIKEIF